MADWREFEILFTERHPTPSDAAALSAALAATGMENPDITVTGLRRSCRDINVYNTINRLHWLGFPAKARVWVENWDSVRYNVRDQYDWYVSAAQDQLPAKERFEDYDLEWMRDVMVEHNVPIVPTDGPPVALVWEGLIPTPPAFGDMPCKVTVVAGVVVVSSGHKRVTGLDRELALERAVLEGVRRG